ncbi:MAG: DUF5694 domain-containing protein [Sulfobacillus sp.]
MKNQVPLLLLGSYHMNNPGRDLHNVVVDDVLSDARQQQIQAVTDGLARFRPTIVAIEVAREQDAAWNDDYQRYCQGQFTLTSDERHQLGFRLAATCGLERIHAVDWNEDLPYIEDDLGAVWAYAKEHHPDLYATVSGRFEGWAREFDHRQATQTVGQLLRWENDPHRLADDHQNYLALATLGEGGKYPAIPWISGWFQRNLTIFVNLSRLVSSLADRILVVYGAGHIPLLRQFAADSGHFAVENAADFLP